MTQLCSRIVLLISWHCESMSATMLRQIKLAFRRLASLYMPQMIPSHPVDGCPGYEITVFDALKKELPKDWIVIHSKRFVLPGTYKHPKPIEREVDFIILNPKRGYIGLEVKGGQEVGMDPDG